jgi:hypothetical protein
MLQALEPGDRGADGGGLHDVVAAALHSWAFPLPDPHLHGGDHDTLAAEPADVTFQFLP